MIRARQFDGRAVVDMDAEKRGAIEEIILDPDRRRVAASRCRAAIRC